MAHYGCKGDATWSLAWNHPGSGLRFTSGSMLLPDQTRPPAPRSYLPFRANSTRRTSKQRPELILVEIRAVSTGLGLLVLAPCFLQAVKNQKQLVNTDVSQ
jgi:hypothetical protein